MVKESFLQLTGQLLKAVFSPTVSESTPVYDAEMLGDHVGGFHQSAWNGDKFYGGFGITKDYDIIDYWLLRRRSKQLFTENIYARGLLRRLITNIVNKGLNLEATPDSTILGLDADMLEDWSEMVERRHNIWGKSPHLCDYKKASTIGGIERQAELMAMISGDVLVVLRQGPTGLPSVELVDADHVDDPLSDTMVRAVRNRGNTIVHGVEIDKAGRHIAFFVRQKDGKFKRVTARGAKTNRVQAWLYYSTERLIDDVRGQSILALMMQSLKEVDRYRDSEQRSAVVNSTIALWVEKTQEKISSLPLNSGATRLDTVTTQNDSHGRKDVEFSSMMPGMMLQELQHGEKPTSYDTKRPNVNFAAFETAILSTIAWANEMPPEILVLQFQKSYTAARGAVVEFKMFLDRKRASMGEGFKDPIYQEFVLSETLQGSITSPGLLEAWRDPQQWDKFGAWMLADWSGAIKPNTDLLKDAKGYKLLMGESLLTRDRSSRELTGMKYSKVVQTLRKENEQYVIAMQPLIDAGLLDTQPEVSASPEVNTQ